MAKTSMLDSMRRKAQALFFVLLICLTLPSAHAQTSKPRAMKPKPSTQEDLVEESFTPKLTYDLGGSTGSYNDRTYTEITLGLNYFFTSWTAWRNALFYRMADSDSSAYGWDTSLRAFLNLSASESVGAIFFAGPGYRFASKGSSAPFVEGGVTFRLGGLAIGGGAKTVFHSVADSQRPNDTQIFLVLAGGGVL